MFWRGVSGGGSAAQEFVVSYGLVAVGAVAAEADSVAEAVAVGAALFAEVASVAGVESQEVVYELSGSDGSRINLS